MNSVTLTGRIGQDLDIRESKDGKTKILNITLAVRGIQKDSTSWINCTIFNGSAEYLNKYAQKGSLIGVEGRLQEESWEDESGNNRRKIVVIASRVEVLSGFANAESDEPVNISSGDLPF